jgi:hypothetical protein
LEIIDNYSHPRKEINEKEQKLHFVKLIWSARVKVQTKLVYEQEDWSRKTPN